MARQMQCIFVPFWIPKFGYFVYLIGYDIGSSSIKAALIEAESGKAIGVVQYPATEMQILAPQPGWAEQDPETWWNYLCQATKFLLLQTAIPPEAIQAIGIAYQMHGLVIVDKHQQVLRPSIIWCDSRAVAIGKEAFEAIGEERCLSHLLNAPANFTASKLKWVKENEPEVYARIHKWMLPGDYIAMRFTGAIATTPAGLSEGVFWDFKNNTIADFLLNHFGFQEELIPKVLPTFSIQGHLTREAAEASGLKPGTPVSYRAGDQPNNALALNVLQPGEVAATGGTSGVVYGVVDKAVYDSKSRVNSFLHVNHSAEVPRIGVLLCINGAGIQYNWLKRQLAADATPYRYLEVLAQEIPIGADGLHILPFGNGAERMLGYKSIGAQILGLNFNRHEKAHLYRAALEGIAFAFVYGVEILQNMGLDTRLMRVGNDNLFQSDVFSQTIATLLNCSIEVIETTGAIGAAKGAGVAIGIPLLYPDSSLKTYEPAHQISLYQQAYQTWRSDLDYLLSK